MNRLAHPLAVAVASVALTPMLTSPTPFLARLVLCATALVLVACSAAERPYAARTVPHVMATTTSPPPAITVAARAARSRTAATRHDPPRVAVAGNLMSDAFWRRVANCESSDGRSGAFLGYFQFSRDTARKVGWFNGAGYAEQLAMAKRWLAMIGGRGGSRSGWPVCWFVALRAGT